MYCMVNEGKKGAQVHEVYINEDRLQVIENCRKHSCPFEKWCAFFSCDGKLSLR